MIIKSINLKSIIKGIDFLQVKNPFLGVMCIPTVITTKN